MMRVPMGTYKSLKIFVALLYLITAILIKLKSSCLDKHSHIMFATGIDLFVQSPRLQVFSMGSSLTSGADAALAFIMSWHEDVAKA